MQKVVVILLLISSAGNLQAFEGEALIKINSHNQIVRMGPPGAPLQEMPSIYFHGETGLSDRITFADGLWLTTMIWASVDSNPDTNPVKTPENKMEFRSRILEFQLVAEIFPAQLIFDIGKKTVRPSLGFFKTPLNLVPELQSRETSKISFESRWAEGNVGLGITTFLGDFTIINYFMPKLEFHESASNYIDRYFLSPQPFWSNFFQAGARFWDVELTAVHSVSLVDPQAWDEARHGLGGSVVTNWGDAFLIRAEGSIRNNLTRRIVSDLSSMTTEQQELNWILESILGMTWTGETGISVIGEYWYQQKGFGGSEYQSMLEYSKKIRIPPSEHPEYALSPDILDQFGMFNAGAHYLFLRLGGALSDGVSGDLWTRWNMLDFSGLTGVSVTATLGETSLGISSLFLHGDRTASEAGLSSLHWKSSLELKWLYN